MSLISLLISQAPCRMSILRKAHVALSNLVVKGHIPDLGDVPMEAAILVHVHPLGPSFRPGGGQALPLPTVNLLTLYSLLLMIALEIHHQLN